MDLVQAGRFSTLAEAQVARSMLHAAEIPAFVPEENVGATAWTYQLALGGFRVLVPEARLAAAKAELKQLEASAPPPAKAAPQSLPVLILTALAVVGVAFVHVAFVPIAICAAVAVLHHSRKRARRDALGD